LQFLSVGHGLHAPPQSTSVSPGESAASVQLIASPQVPPSHTPPRQSVAVVQPPPAGHPGQPPPQSMPVSWPFIAPSVQLGAAPQRPASQVPLAQSSATLQRAPSTHGVQPPPQSMALSAPSWVPFWHWAMSAGMSRPGPSHAAAERAASAASTIRKALDEHIGELQIETEATPASRVRAT